MEYWNLKNEYNRAAPEVGKAVFQSLPPGHGVTMPGGNDKWKVPFWGPVGLRKDGYTEIYHVTIIPVFIFFLASISMILQTNFVRIYRLHIIKEYNRNLQYLCDQTIFHYRPMHIYN